MVSYYRLGQRRSSAVTTSLADHLRRARERVHLTQEQVEQRTDIGTSTLSELENGHREPSLVQLDRLARVYGRSAAWFLEDAPEEADEVVLWRQRPEQPVAAEVGARFLQLCEQFRDLEVWCDEPVDGELSKPTLRPRERFGFRDAARLAKHVRDDLQLGDRPGEGLMRTLEEVCGVKVFHLRVEPEGTAACAWSESFGAAVLLNAGNVPWRRSFDLAHELFHLLTWELFRPGWCGDPLVASELEERLANVFAENLLMPEEPFFLAVDRRMKSPDPGRIDQVHALAREFGVSVPAVLVRMKFLFDLEEEAVAAAREEWPRTARYFEDRDREPTPERPERFRALALTALRRGELSIGRFAEYMGISRYRAMAIAREQEEHGAEEDPAAPA